MQSTMWSKLASRVYPVFTRPPLAALPRITSLNHTTDPTQTSQTIRTVTTTAVRNDLMEFFETKKNWGEREIKVGRAWKIDELRLKSNTDLHKLWYILLKELNMLKTMEHDAKTECQYFPNPERIDKVEESMVHLEEVVRERNRAYFELETGTTGERSGEEFENWLGLPEYRQFEEHAVPKEENRDWHIKRAEEPQSSPAEKQYYYKFLREKQKRQANKEMRFMLYQIHELVRTFPDMDIDALKEKFPEVPAAQVDKIVAQKKERIYENNTVPRDVAIWRGAYCKKHRKTWKQYYGLN